jgi:hypothetical protein
MALNINTSRLNDALRQMASFFMQNKLGELSQQRQMDTYSEQDRLMRERSAAEDVAAQRGRQDQFKLDKDKAILNGLLKAAENPDIKGLGQKSETLKIAGRMAEAEAVDKELADRIEASVGAWVQTQTGEPLDTNQFRAMIMAGGLDKTLSASNEGGTNRRAAQQLPLQTRATATSESQARTSAGNLALQQTKAIQSETGNVPQDEYYKIWHSKIEGVKKVILGFKEAYASPDTTPQERMDIAQILSQVEVKPTEFLKTLSDLNRIDTKAITKRLTPNDEKWLDKFGGFGENNPMPEEAPSPIPGTAVGGVGRVGASSTTSSHTKGERKPYTDPRTGKQAMYEWDGSQWTFIQAL